MSLSLSHSHTQTHTVPFDAFVIMGRLRLPVAVGGVAPCTRGCASVTRLVSRSVDRY